MSATKKDIENTEGLEYEQRGGGNKENPAEVDSG